jgi:Mg2+-importing ATPase
MPNEWVDRFWTLSTEDLLHRLAANSAGLSSADAEHRLARYGANTIAEAPRLRIITRIAKRFAEPLVAILLVAAAISGAIGDLGSFGIIATVVVLSITLDLVQEHRAERAADALKRSVAVHADVRRDGAVIALPVEQLVPGDVVELRSGDLVPADGIVLQSRNAHANEALMTGEAYPVDKYPGSCAAITPPEAFKLLPMIMTVTLARGALRMAQRRVVVKKLAAIHDLGAMDVLCTDKTGTLTEARIALLRHPGPDGADDERVLMLAAVNSRFETGIRSPLDEAIERHSPNISLAGWSKIDEVPFDFERRRISVLVERDHERLLIVKGAPEGILERANSVDGGEGQILPIDATRHAALLELERNEAAQGNRVLAVAWKPMPPGRSALLPEDECDLIVSGFCVFIDPPKPDAAEAIVRLGNAGVRIKLLSGDSAAVTQHIARTLGMPAERVITGAEIAELNDAALAVCVEDIDIFARVSPDQKTRVVLALRQRGHTLGFLGDGVNDAPAIHAADVGLSVEGATDVAREAADMIMLVRNLNVLADGVEEGRRTFANILKYVRMATSSNFGNMLSMALASIFLPFLPLTPIQVLLNNLLYDLSEIGIPFDRVEREEIAQPRAWDMKEILRFTAIMGVLSSIFDIATFAILIFVFGAAPDVFRTAWFLESIATQILVIFIIRTHAPAWVSRPHPMLAMTSLTALAAAPLLVFSPAGAGLGFVVIPIEIVAAIILIVLAYLACAEIAKRTALGGKAGVRLSRRLHSDANSRWRAGHGPGETPGRNIAE